MLLRGSFVEAGVGDLRSSQILGIAKTGSERKREEMGIVVKAGDWAFKAFTAGLGVTTIYLTGTFSLNVYRGIAWHKAQPKIEQAS